VLQGGHAAAQDLQLPHSCRKLPLHLGAHVGALRLGAATRHPGLSSMHQMYAILLQEVQTRGWNRCWVQHQALDERGLHHSRNKPEWWWGTEDDCHSQEACCSCGTTCGGTW
jgi:hypothetical protein